MLTMRLVGKFLRSKSTFVLLLTTFLSLCPGVVFPDSGAGPKQILRFGPGIHKLDAVVLDSPHALLAGEGKGITILMVPGGVTCTATNPIIRDLSIVGSSRGAGITLRNTWSAQILDVSVDSFATGIRLELGEEGRKRAKETKGGWPSALAPGHWGSRMTLTELRSVDIVGEGDGLVFRNFLKDGNRGGLPEFFTATTVWGGHIAVRGKSVVIGDHVWNTKFIGTYIDIHEGGGIYMEKNAWDLALVGVVLDMSASARRAGTHKIFAASERGARSIRYDATTTLTEREINVEKWDGLNKQKK